MRLVIISLDLLLALPILSVATALLLSSIIGSQRYLLSEAELQNRTLNLVVTSQQIAGALDSNAINYSTASSLASSLSKNAGLASAIVDQGQKSRCSAQLTLCRLVTVSGSTRLLVVSYANAG